MRRFLLILLLQIVFNPLFASGLKDERSLREVRVLYVPGVADPFYYSLEKGAREKAEDLGVLLSVSPLSFCVGSGRTDSDSDGCR